MLIRSISKLLLFASILVYAGCSGGNSSVMPSDTPGENQFPNIENPVQVGVSDWFADGSPASGQGVLGLYSLHLDPLSEAAEIAPLRQSSATDVLEVVDITNFLTLATCQDCLNIQSVELDIDGNLVLSIGIKHPFGIGDPFKPPTGQNRADLHVFNIEGAIVSDAPGIAFGGLGETIPGFTLVNADGYSGYLDTVLEDILTTDATLHPYILHFDDYSLGNFAAGNTTGFESVTDPGPSGNLVMPMGSDYDYQDYVFDLTNGTSDFIFAIGCTYAVSADNKAMRFTPEYRVPQHSKKAASEVWVEIVTNDLRGEDIASSADLEIKVLDMNHGVAVGEALDEMLADSSVASVSIEIPGVLTAPIIETSIVPTGNGRDPLDPLTFPITVTNDAGGTEGTYSGLVKVLDSYATGQNQSPLLEGSDGIKRVGPVENPLTGTFDIDEFATYATFTIDVAVGLLLEACFTFDPPSVRIEIDPTINFDGSCSNDPNAYNIVQYEWDWEWDGDPLTFAADDITATPTTSHDYTSPGTHTVGLRITNDASNPQTSEIFSDDVLVHGWVYPAVKLTEPDVTSVGMWWCVDKRIVTTSDGTIHVLLYVNYNEVRYHQVNQDGTVANSQALYSGSTMEVEIRSTPSDEIYCFFVKGTGDMVYRKMNGTGFDPEVFMMTRETGKYMDAGGFAINPSGDILAMSSEYGSHPDSAYVYFTVDEGSGFSAKTLIDTPDRWTTSSGNGVGITIDATADSTGTFHMGWDGLPALYDSNRDIWYASYDGSLSAISGIAVSGSQEYFPNFRVAANDDVYCGFRQYTTNYMAIKPAANTTFDAYFPVAQYSYPNYKQNWSYDLNPDNGEIMHIWYNRNVSNNLRVQNFKIYNTADTQSEMLAAPEFRLDDASNALQMWANVTRSPEGHWYTIWGDQRAGGQDECYFMMYY